MPIKYQANTTAAMPKIVTAVGFPRSSHLWSQERTHTRACATRGGVRNSRVARVYERKSPRAAQRALNALITGLALKLRAAFASTAVAFHKIWRLLRDCVDSNRVKHLQGMAPSSVTTYDCLQRVGTVQSFAGKYGCTLRVLLASAPLPLVSENAQ